MAGGGDSVKAILWALGANFFIAAFKFLGAFITNSGTMLAEGIHSVADCVNQVLLLIGVKSSKKPPSVEYPLGHGKVVYFWSFVVAILLFSVGGLYSIYEGTHKLKHPEPVTPEYWTAVWILLGCIIAEGFSVYGCMKEVNKDRGEKSVFKWFGETRKSELLVIFGEDFAAMIGLCFAFVFVLLAILTENPIYDAVGSITIGVLLVIVAFFITIQIKKLLVGRSAEPQIREGIQEYIANYQGVEKIYNMITFQLGPHIMVAAKVKMSDKDSDSQSMIENINRCEEGLKKHYPEILWLFFEPDLKDN